MLNVIVMGIVLFQSLMLKTRIDTHQNIISSLASGQSDLADALREGLGLREAGKECIVDGTGFEKCKSLYTAPGYPKCNMQKKKSLITIDCDNGELIGGLQQP